MAKSDLHEIADEQVDYYKNNAEFISLLDDYHNNKADSKAYDRLWMIAYQAACNFLKKRMGHWWSYEKIEGMALDMLNVLFARINNREKWPEGYRVLNLPTVIEGIFLQLHYSKKAKETRKLEYKIFSWEELIEIAGDGLYNYLADTKDEHLEEAEQED